MKEKNKDLDKETMKTRVKCNNNRVLQKWLTRCGQIIYKKVSRKLPQSTKGGLRGVTPCVQGPPPTCKQGKEKSPDRVLSSPRVTLDRVGAGGCWFDPSRHLETGR